MTAQPQAGRVRPRRIRLPSDVERPKPNRPEHELQCAFHSWMQRQYPKVIAYSVPNMHQQLDARGGKYLNDEGRTRGIPDYNIDEARGGYHGARVEFKSKGNKPTDAQIKMLHRLNAAGYYAFWTDDLFKAIESVNAYMRGKQTA